MDEKPTYEELVLRIKALEKEKQERNRMRGAAIHKEEWPTHEIKTQKNPGNTYSGNGPPIDHQCQGNPVHHGRFLFSDEYGNRYTGSERERDRSDGMAGYMHKISSN